MVYLVKKIYMHGSQSSQVKNYCGAVQFSNETKEKFSNRLTHQKLQEQ